MDTWKSLFKQLWVDINPQHNYHGTPYTFNEFDDSKIKSGYGLNVHGRGHYTTPDKGWAKEFGPTLYRVDIPSKEYFYKTYDSFSMDNPINFKPIKQSQFVLDNLKKSPTNIDYFKMLPLDDIERIGNMVYDLPTPRYKESWAVDRMFDIIYKRLSSGKEITPQQKDLFNRIMNKSGLNTKVIYLDKTNNNHLLKSIVGDIKGISTYDEWSTPTNLIFSGKDIKMANTPLQRVVNRIPTQTLGKMANKAYNIPAVKQAIKFLPAVGTAEMILQGLSQPVGDATVRPKKDVLKDYLPLTQGVYNYGKY